MLAGILICEQLPLIRNGLRALLDAQPDIEVIATTDDVQDAVLLAKTHRPDAILIGTIRLEASVDLLRAVRGEGIDGRPHCLVFYQELTSAVVTELLQAGAKGLLNRDADADEVVAAAGAVARGRTALNSEVAAHLVERVRGHGITPRVAAAPETRTLTDREREVLTMIGRGLSPEDIAVELYIGVSTVRTHLHHIRHKLDLRDRAQMVAFAYQSGLVRKAA